MKAQKWFILLGLLIFVKTTLAQTYYPPMDSSMLLTVKISNVENKQISDTLYVSLIDSSGNILETKKGSTSKPTDFEVKADKYYMVRVRDSFIVRDKCPVSIEINVSTYNKTTPFTIVVNAEIWRPIICCTITIDNIFYEKKTTTFSSTAKETIGNLVSLLNTFPFMEISMHTSVSINERNRRSYLTKKRNQNLLLFLSQQGIDVKRIFIERNGKKVEPIDKSLGATSFKIIKLK